MPTLSRPLTAVQVTLTLANTNYNLLDLVNAVIAAEATNSGGIVASGSVRSFSIQAHPGIDGVGGNTNDVLVGDGLLSTTRMGMVLSAGVAYSDRSTNNNVNFAGFFARSAGAGQMLNIILYS